MKRELRRQIDHLEGALSEFRREHAPFDAIPSGPATTPTVLETEQLEFVRDDLLFKLSALQDRAAQRFAHELDAPPPLEDPQPTGWRARLRRKPRRSD